MTSHMIVRLSFVDIVGRFLLMAFLLSCLFCVRDIKFLLEQFEDEIGFYGSSMVVLAYFSIEH